MSKEKLFYLLQMSGGTFPTGGFSQSWGLETYVSDGKIKNNLDFQDFLRMYLNRVIENYEGPAYCHAYDLALKGDSKELSELETLLMAMKLTKETKEAGIRTGKAFMRMASEMLDDIYLKEYYNENKSKGISYPLAFGMVCARLGIEKLEGLKAYVFSTINGLLQSGIKLIPLGNTEAQALMCSVHVDMEECVKIAIKKPIDEIENFCPALDIASMRHESLATRLYMS